MEHFNKNPCPIQNKALRLIALVDDDDDGDVEIFFFSIKIWSGCDRLLRLLLSSHFFVSTFFVITLDLFLSSEI